MKHKNHNNKKSAGVEMISGYEVENGQVLCYLSVFGWVNFTTQQMHVSLVVGKAGKKSYFGCAKRHGYNPLAAGAPRVMTVDPEVYRNEAPAGTVPVAVQFKRVEPIYTPVYGTKCLSWRVASMGTPGGAWTSWAACPITVETSNQLTPDQYELVNRFAGGTVICQGEDPSADAPTSLEDMVASLQSALQTRGLRKNKEVRKAAPINWGGLVTHVDVTTGKDEIIAAVRFTRPQRDLILSRLKDIDIACPALEDLPLRRGRLSKQESQGTIQYSSEQLECLNSILEHTGYALVFVPEYGIYGLRHIKTGQLIELSAADVAFLRYGKECSVGGGELV